MVRNSWNIADIEFVWWVGGWWVVSGHFRVKPNFCYVRLSWVGVVKIKLSINKFCLILIWNMHLMDQKWTLNKTFFILTLDTLIVFLVINKLWLNWATLGICLKKNSKFPLRHNNCNIWLLLTLWYAILVMLNIPWIVAQWREYSKEDFLNN